MATHRIAVIGGDGIGPEVIEQAIRVVDVAGKKHGATFEWNRLPWGSDLYKKAGHILPPDGPEEDGVVLLERVPAVGRQDVAGLLVEVRAPR